MKEHVYLICVRLDENGIGEALITSGGHGVARIPIQTHEHQRLLTANVIGVTILEDAKRQQQLFADRPAGSPRVSPPIPENGTIVIPHGEQKSGMPDTIVGHLFNQKTRQIEQFVHTFDPTNEPMINPDLSVVERQQDREISIPHGAGAGSKTPAVFVSNVEQLAKYNAEITRLEAQYDHDKLPPYYDEVVGRRNALKQWIDRENDRCLCGGRGCNRCEPQGRG